MALRRDCRRCPSSSRLRLWRGCWSPFPWDCRPLGRSAAPGLGVAPSPVASPPTRLHVPSRGTAVPAGWGRPGAARVGRKCVGPRPAAVDLLHRRRRVGDLDDDEAVAARRGLHHDGPGSGADRPERPSVGPVVGAVAQQPPRFLTASGAQARGDPPAGGRVMDDRDDRVELDRHPPLQGEDPAPARQLDHQQLRLETQLHPGRPLLALAPVFHVSVRPSVPRRPPGRQDRCAEPRGSLHKASRRPRRCAACR